MQLADASTLESLLKRTSRSFYLTLRALPKSIRSQIGLAYLLARASDTIADTDAIPKASRLLVLQGFRDWVVSGKESVDLRDIAGQQTSAAERDLLHHLKDAVSSLAQFQTADQQRIRAVLDIIVSGQVLDVERFAGASRDKPASLETEEQLDDYTYRVAGCVGEFWTKMCRAHVFPDAPLNDALLLRNGIRFGKGLQLVNILRDLPADVRMGRCYLPNDQLAQCQLSPTDLLDPSNEARLFPVYRRFLGIAQEHLGAGWDYTNTLPFRSARVRLACAWPILIGTQTLARLRQSTVLNPANRIKVTRKEVRTILVRSILFYPWPRKWRELINSGPGLQRNTLPREASLAK